MTEEATKNVLRLLTYKAVNEQSARLTDLNKKVDNFISDENKNMESFLIGDFQLNHIYYYYFNGKNDFDYLNQSVSDKVFQNAHRIRKITNMDSVLEYLTDENYIQTFCGEIVDKCYDFTLAEQNDYDYSQLRIISKLSSRFKMLIELNRSINNEISNNNKVYIEYILNGNKSKKSIDCDPFRTGGLNEISPLSVMPLSGSFNSVEFSIIDRVTVGKKKLYVKK